MSDVKVIKLGLGEVISNWGTYEGVPAIFIEPAEAPGLVGHLEPDGEERKHSLREGSVVIQIHDCSGVQIVAEDFLSALREAGKPLPFTMAGEPPTEANRPKPIHI